MQFTYGTLSSTAQRFEQALKAKGLKLPKTRAFNVWAQIVAGKNFSAIKAQADKVGHIRAVPISTDTIRNILRERSREVTHAVAAELFADAIRDDLPELSPCLAELIEFIRMDESSCLFSFGLSSTGLVTFDATKPGYLPVNQLLLVDGREEELEWLRTNAELMASVGNRLAGLRDGQEYEIFRSSSIHSAKKSNDVFAAFLTPRIEPLAQALATQAVMRFDPIVEKDPDEFDYDQVRDLIYEEIDLTMMEVGRNSWLKTDCDLGEALIDHLAARIREVLKWLTEAGEDEYDSPESAIARTASLSMQNLLNKRTPS